MAVSEELQIPKCLAMITPQDVIRRIELYYEGGREELRIADCGFRIEEYVLASSPPPLFLLCPVTCFLSTAIASRLLPTYNRVYGARH